MPEHSFQTPKPGAIPTMQGHSVASVRDWLSLTKPRVMSLAIFSAACGYSLATLEAPSSGALAGVISILAIALGSGGAGCLNMWFEIETDRMMARTAHRPGPRGVILPDDMLAFGIGLSLAGLCLLLLAAGIMAAALLLLTILYYVVIYTMWLKPRTPHSISIGGIAGALPPLIGWVAAGGGLSWHPFILVMIIAVWTPPHFWSLGLLLKEEYTNANFPIHPVRFGSKKTSRAILHYTLVLGIIVCLPGVLGYQHPATLAFIVPCHLLFLAKTVRLARKGEDKDLAKQVFIASIRYLFLILGMMGLTAWL